jgi:hypothetical protein
MAELNAFASVLHQSRTQAHVWHHQTISYSEHKALENYYTEIVELIDGLIESVQGIRPRVVGYTTSPLVDWKEGQSINYFKGLYDYVAKERAGVGSETWVQNQIDEIAQLIAETLYQLSLK